MLPIRTLARTVPSKRLVPVLASQFSTASRLALPNRKDIPSNNDPKNPNQPHVPNVNSTLTTEFPSVGKAPPPPEFVGTVDPSYASGSKFPTAGKEGEVSGSVRSGHGVRDPSESEWAKFIAEPIKRVGEDERTMRARLVYQSRKRGILETDLLLSTFADENLSKMSIDQLREYDSFLNENDWDIYYWCTQDPPVDLTDAITQPDIPTKDEGAVTETTAYNTPSSKKTASPVHPDGKIQSPPGPQGLGSIEQPMMNRAGSWGDIKGTKAVGGEWAQTVGTVKVAYRPVPEKWQNSWVLKAIRDHVEGRRARNGGGEKAKGLGRMPELRV